MKRFSIVFFFALVVSALLTASAETLERHDGIKIGERMTLRPFVSLSLTYDTNVDSNDGDSSGTDKEDCFWSISPSLWLHYNAENWSVILSGFYSYRQYLKSCHNNAWTTHDYGEDLRWNWANSTGADKGWSMVLGQSFHQISRAGDLVTPTGSTYGGDSRQFQFSGALQRRFNQYWHGDLNASYYWLDYDDSGNPRNTASFYGWQRWMVGLEAGCALSRWTDIIVSGSYQGYQQDNVEGTQYANNSDGWTVQAGLGSYMTDRISYRLMGGISRFNYADGDSSDYGFVYTASGNWKIGETWNTMLLATSYYQPSERQQSSKSRVDAVSWGIAKQMIRGKLRAMLDVRYRRETNEYVEENSGYDYVLNIITGRIGLTYSICRYLSVHGNLEYQRSLNDEADNRRGAYDYDRMRATLGLSVSY